MRYKNLGRTFFGFVAIYAFDVRTDGQTDEQTDSFFVAILRCMRERGKNDCNIALLWHGRRKTMKFYAVSSAILYFRWISADLCKSALHDRCAWWALRLLLSFTICDKSCRTVTRINEYFIINLSVRTELLIIWAKEFNDDWRFITDNVDWGVHTADDISGQWTALSSSPSSQHPQLNRSSSDDDCSSLRLLVKMPQFELNLCGYTVQC